VIGTTQIGGVKTFCIRFLAIACHFILLDGPTGLTVQSRSPAKASARSVDTMNRSATHFLR
jgi:hypothetical protein